MSGESQSESSRMEDTSQDEITGRRYHPLAEKEREEA
jgi:hypothetical protein